MTAEEQAKKKLEEEAAAAEESEEIDYETADANIQEIIEEMKKRRRNVDEDKQKEKSNNIKQPKIFEDYNPLRAIQDHENNSKNHLKWKLLTLVSCGHCLVGAVFHVVRPENAAEFDPYYIERIKNCLTLMVEKDLVRQLELELV